MKGTTLQKKTTTMPKRISWKKGMRLTDEVLIQADRCTSESFAQAYVLAAEGRFGLFPSVRPFQLALNVEQGAVNVESLDCMGITRAGDIIDVRFDTKFTNTFNTRVQIPDQEGAKEFILVVNADPDTWKDTNEGLLVPDYSFSFVGAKQAVPDHALPIARIVYNDGWTEDNVFFVPPCLTVSSHPKFMELCQQFLGVLQAIDEKSRQQSDTLAKTAISVYWPVVIQTLIEVNNEREALTPMRLMSCVQRIIGIFTCACDVDEVLSLEEAEPFRNFARVPYNYRQAYLRLKQGIGMCSAISDKIDKFSQLRETQPVAPPPRQEPPKEDRRRWNGPNI